MSTRGKNINIEYGFKNRTSLSYKLFKAIPIYPKITTFTELKKDMKLTTSELSGAFCRLPADAPIFQDLGEIGRIK